MNRLLDSIALGAIFFVMLGVLLTGCPPADVKDATWQSLPSPSTGNSIYRTPTPYGWLVVTGAGSVTYVPDGDHEWFAAPRPGDAPAAQAEVVPGDF